MNKITWKNEKRKVSELKSFEGNPRQANEKQIKDLDKSLERFSLAAPLVINTDGTVIGGNFRLSREKERGAKEVDVRVPNRKLTRKESEELNLRLNKNLGSWDNEVLTNFSEDILLDVGWNKDELDEIFGLEIADDNKKEYEEAKRSPSDKNLELALLTRIVILLREIRNELRRERTIK